MTEGDAIWEGGHVPEVILAHRLRIGIDNFQGGDVGIG